MYRYRLMKKKKNPSVFRHWFQAAFFALTNGYASGFVKGKIFSGENKVFCVPGLNCYSCPGALFSCPIGSLQAVITSSEFTVSCYVFGFIMAVGALFGRLVCGFLCPFGLVQDLLYKIPFVKKLKNLPGHKYLRFLRYIVLAVFVFLLSGLIVNDAGNGKPWYCEFICPSGTLFAGIPLVASNPGLADTIGWRFWLKIAILAATLLLSVISFRPFCKYVCPLGALYGVCNPISLYRYRVAEDKCIGCGACQKACNMDIKVWKTPNSTQCIRCGECKAACPTGAITSTWDELKRRCVKDLPDELKTPRKAKAATAAAVSATADAAAAAAADTTVAAAAAAADTMVAAAADTTAADTMVAAAADTTAAAAADTTVAAKAEPEKSSMLRMVLGIAFIAVGALGALLLAMFGISSFSSILNGVNVDVGDIVYVVCIFGIQFMGLAASIIMIIAGIIPARAGGTLTSSTRSLRVMLPAVMLLIAARLLSNIYTNLISALVCAVLLVIAVLLWTAMMLSCVIKKKEKK